MAAPRNTVKLIRHSGHDLTGTPVEVLDAGPIQIKVLENGENTSTRLSSILLTIAPHTPGPMLHWHRMHDETFLVTKGKVRFHTKSIDGPGAKDKETGGDGDVDAAAGDYVVVPVQAIHSFSNPFDEPAEFFNTFTPSYYIEYLRMMAKAAQKQRAEGIKGPLSVDTQKAVMAQFATFAPGDEGFVDD